MVDYLVKHLSKLQPLQHCFCYFYIPHGDRVPFAAPRVQIRRDLAKGCNTADLRASRSIVHFGLSWHLRRDLRQGPV